jgi:hypothetical protein
VEARIERTKTAQTLFQVNDLLSKGQASAADRLLDKETGELVRHRSIAIAQPLPMGAASAQLADDFDGQLAALGSARKAVAPAAKAIAESGGDGFGSGSTGGGGFRHSSGSSAPAPASPTEVKAAIRQNNANAGPLAF